MKRMVETKAVALIESMAAKNVTPEMILAPKIGDLVDADGNKRFFDLVFTRNPALTNLSIVRGLACLNGKSLMIVGTVNRNLIGQDTPLAAGTLLATITIPEWLGKKIYNWTGAASGLVRHFQCGTDDLNLNPVIQLIKNNDTTLIVQTAVTDLTYATIQYAVSFEINLAIE